MAPLRYRLLAETFSGITTYRRRPSVSRRCTSSQLFATTIVRGRRLHVVVSRSRHRCRVVVAVNASFSGHGDANASSPRRVSTAKAEETTRRAAPCTAVSESGMCSGGRVAINGRGVARRRGRLPVVCAVITSQTFY